MEHRFTIDGNVRLEASLAAFQEEVRAETYGIIPETEVESILLGGGYGRGEGGVLQLPDQQWPYNDFEYYIFVRGNVPIAQKKYHQALAAMGDRLGKRWNMHVDFKIASIPKWAGQTVSMFSYDLLERHFCVAGRDTPFPGCDHHHRADQIPLTEATRLMFNRCSGLLFSDMKLNERDPDEEDIDFITRNQAKLCLALGDSLLCALGCYHWSCRERHQRLLTMEAPEAWLDLEPIRNWHREGVAFKLHPAKHLFSVGSLRERQEQLTKAAGTIWLWIENKRLMTACASIPEYLSDRIDKFPDRPRIKSALLNMKHFGFARPWSSRYPRERLYHALGWLLWEKEAPDALRQASLALRAGSLEKAVLIRRYEQLWERFG